MGGSNLMLSLWKTPKGALGGRGGGGGVLPRDIEGEREREREQER